MNENTFKERVTRLKEVNGVLEKLDPSIRSQAFDLLKPYITGRPAVESGDGASEEGESEEADGDGSAEAFFSKFNDEKPSDNALLVAAYVYSRYGVTAFTVEEVRKLATDVGLTIPDRVDMTFIAAQRDGKALFRRAGKGEFRPTVYGEAHLKTTYNVKKGKVKKEPTAE